MKNRILYYLSGLFLLPLFLAGVFILSVRVQSYFRYDAAYFTPQYQKQYGSPGSVAAAVEHAVKDGDFSSYAELTGLRVKSNPPEPNPNLRLMIALKVTDNGYFQYLFFDVKNYQRTIYQMKKVHGRWVVAPPDAFYFLDSGEWLVFFTPLVTIWWSLLAVIAIGLAIFRIANHFRDQIYRPPSIQ